MSDTAGVAYRINQMGAEGVRQRLQEINDELKAGAPVTKELNKEVKDLGASLNLQSRVVRLNEQSWKAQHQTLLTAGRVMSMVGGIARSALAVTTAWSVASLAFGKSSSGLAQARQELELAQAQLAQALSMGADPETIAKFEENVNRARTVVKDFEDQELQKMITDGVNMAATFSIMGSSVLQIIPKLAQLSAALLGTRVTMTALSPAISVASVSTRTFGMALRGLWAALGPVGWAILGLSIAIPLLIEYWPEITAAFQGFINFMSATFGPALMAIWEGVKSGFVMFLNGMITTLNAAGFGIVKGIEFIANGFISWINGIIGSYNAVAGALGLGKLGKLGKITIPFEAIPMISAATGFQGQLNRDTMFLAHKGEDVSITPASKSGRGGGSGNVTVIVHGDVSGDELIDKVRMALKDNLRYDKHYTGF